MIILNLVNLRKRNEISQFEVAYFLNMDQKTYHNIENSLTLHVKVEVYIKLAFLYDVSIDYLLGITTVKGEFPNDMKDEVIEKYNIDLYLVKRLREKGTFQDLQKANSSAPSP